MSSNLKINIKRVISATFYYFSLFSYLSSKFKNFSVLTYHRVLPDSKKSPIYIQNGMFVYKKTFEQHLIQLQKNKKIININDLLHHLGEEQDITAASVITLDDGWLDNYTEAFPLLKKYQVPATIFLTTGFIGIDRHFWPDEIIYYLRQIDNFHASEADLLSDLLSQMTTKHKNELFFDEAVEILKKWQPDKRDTLLKDLRTNCLSPPPERQMMNWDEVKEMHDSGLVSFGAHTVNHVILDQVSLEEAEREIVQSKNDIIYHLGVAPEFFAYPNGNYTPEIKELLEKHGFRAAFTTKKGKVGKKVDLFEVPRIGIHQDIGSTIPMFLARIFLKGF